MFFSPLKISLTQFENIPVLFCRRVTGKMKERYCRPFPPPFMKKLSHIPAETWPNYIILPAHQDIFSTCI